MMRTMKNLRNACSALVLLSVSISVFSQPTLRSVADLKDAPAMRWAESGNSIAQFIVGSAFYTGEEIGQDYAEATKWFRRAAEQGHADAQNSLGVMLLHGQGTKQDDAEAVHWFRLAAGQGNPEAQSNLGAMFAEGKGVTQSYVDAVKWYRSAAQQGNSGGQGGLGFMYAKGQGVEQSFEEAYFWLSLAASKSDEYREFRDITARLLTPEQIRNLQQRTINWQPKTSQSYDSSP